MPAPMMQTADWKTCGSVWSRSMCMAAESMCVAAELLSPEDHFFPFCAGVECPLRSLAGPGFYA